MSSSIELEPPFTWEELPAELEALKSEVYTGPATVMKNMVASQNPSGMVLPKKFGDKMAKRIYNMKLRPDDVWMITYPKAGSTWTQEMVWQIAHGFDVEGGKASIFFRAPFLEISCICADGTGATPSMDAEDPSEKMGAIMADSIKYVESIPSPRIIKTHLPLEFLPPNLLETCKVVWVARNVKDSAVSFYNHEQLLPNHGLKPESFEQWCPLYMKGMTLFGNYWSHLKSGWANRDHPNLQLIWFEEMKADLPAVIRKLANFLGQDFPEDKVDALASHLHFDNFKNNDAVNMKPPKGKVPDAVRDNFNFIRKGKVGDWKNYFQGDNLASWDKWIENNNTDNIPMKFEQQTGSAGGV